MPAARAIAIHGHFYQPPRENPWLEAVEIQDSAAPYHDWNERVTAESYAPNTAARRVDAANRVIDIVNNFEKISFDIGPTLFAWLDRRAPDVYRKIVDADRASVHAHGGHGNAIAQVYNHMIMPLATRRDRLTQVRWGLADFRARFGREAEGMWLPETAVDSETLEVLVDEGLRFTILAPAQARRVRRLEAEDPWHDVGEDGIDPRRPYLWRGPHGQDLAIFFYDGAISRAIAFEHLLERGEDLARRLHEAFAEREEPQLVHCATDGESYGHHSRFGDMALAAALRILEGEEGVALTNYGAFLAAHPPTHEVQIHERTSWSCGHGIGRWQDDCGCRVRPDWHQRWRRPLRATLDWLRDQVDPFFEARASVYLKDLWQARDDYIDVVLDRSRERLDAFFARHQRVALDDAARVDVRRLLELQRNRMLMFTSCGWFFDEISGIEPAQILRYAAMALQYVRDLGGDDLEQEFVRRLAEAPSNVPEFGNGAGVYRRLIKPAVVDLRRVVAHYAITGLFEEHPDDARVYAYRVERLDEAREAYGGTALRVGHVRVASEVTGETREATYTVLHFGGHDFACGVRPYRSQPAYEALREDLLGRYARFTLADMVRGMDDYYPGDSFSLTDLFLEERRRVLDHVIHAVLERYEETYRRMWEENRKLVRYLRQADAPIPEALALVARYVLEQEMIGALRVLATAGAGTAIPQRVFDLAAEAHALGLELDLTPARRTMQVAVQRALAAVGADPTAQPIGEAITLVQGARRLGVRFGLWGAQNRFFDTWHRRRDARPALAPLGVVLGFSPDLKDPETPA